MKTNSQIIILHGALGTDAQMVEIATNLMAAGYAVYNILLPGHGKCPLKGEFSPEHFAAYVYG